MSTCGTTAGACGTTTPKSSTTACPSSAILGVLQFAETRRDGGCSKEPKERWCKRNIRVREIPLKHFQRGPPLNSMTFLRLKTTGKKRRETPSSIVFEGHQIVLCLVMICLKCSMHTISPQKHCHQSPKQLRDKYALTSSPFWWIDDNTGFAHRDKNKT